MTPELSRPVRIDTLGAVPRRMALDADAAERAALARRFELPDIERLSAEMEITRNGQIVRAKGTLSARVTQNCIATGAPIAADIAEALDLEFRPQPHVSGPDEEIELDESELDVIFYEGSVVNVGEAVAESLSLALDPYPRCAEADAALAGAGVHREGEEPRTGALAGLKDLLAGKS